MSSNRSVAQSEFADAKAAYDRDGYFVLKDYLNPSELKVLRSRAVPLAEKVKETDADKTGRYPDVLKSLHKHDEWFAEQLYDGRHVPLLRHVMGDDIVGASAAWFDRPEGATFGIKPHVDALGLDQGYDDGATIWYALDPVTVGNGCLHYLKGSHRKSYPHVIPIPGVDEDSKDAVAIELNAGDAVVHSALTVHWSGGNSSGEPRRAVSYFYFSTRAYEALVKNRKEA